MGFLDNGGDIILDAVHTDLGRERLARGEYKIVKFALTDDEIDYGTYDLNHTSGSAYYDLETLQTLIHEAMTNDGSVMNSKLMTVTRDNLLYLPILKLNEVFEKSTERHSDGVFVIAVDEETENSLSIVNNDAVTGIMFGENLQGGSYIRVDQGLDTTDLSPGQTMDTDLIETQYMIRIDNRFGTIVNKDTGDQANISFIDDDNLATYFVTLGTNPGYVKNNTDTTTSNKQTIVGPRGTFVQFQIKASMQLNTSRQLFTDLGSSKSMSAGASTVTVDFIDTTVRIEGATTGIRVDVPIRFTKQQ